MGKNNKKKLYDIIIVLLIITIIISGYFVIMQKEEEKEVLIEITETAIEEPMEKTITVKDEINAIKEKYDNNDVIAILTNNDKKLYVPITQYKDNDYYLKHSIKKKSSILGNPFMDYRHNYKSKQINIYGHNSTKYHPPFQTLVNYTKKSYFEDHKTITLKIKNEIKKYEIFSVLIAKKDGSEEHMQFDFKSISDWKKHFKKLKDRSLYDTKVNVDGSDNILVLQTCIYGKYYGKLIVIAAKEKGI